MAMIPSRTSRLSSTTKIEILFATADLLPRDSLSSLRFGVASGGVRAKERPTQYEEEYAAQRRSRATVASPQHARTSYGGATLASSSSTNTRRSVFNAPLFGSSARNSTVRGTLYAARFSRQ